MAFELCDILLTGNIARVGIGYLIFIHVVKPKRVDLIRFEPIELIGDVPRIEIGCDVNLFFAITNGGGV